MTDREATRVAMLLAVDALALFTDAGYLDDLLSGSLYSDDDEPRDITDARIERGQTFAQARRQEDLANKAGLYPRARAWHLAAYQIKLASGQVRTVTQVFDNDAAPTDYSAASRVHTQEVYGGAE